MSGVNNCINNSAYSLTATTGGLTATAGGLTVTAGSTTLTPLAGTNGGVVVSSTAGVITHIENPSTNGQLLVAAANGTNPVWASVTSGDGSITITPGAHTLALSVTSPSGMVWAIETNAIKTIVINSGYIANRGGGVAFALPGTSAVGTTFAIAGKLGLWSITQAATQYVLFRSTTTTAGAGGSITATNAQDCLFAVCIEADKGWVVTSSVGNLTLA